MLTCGIMYHLAGTNERIETTQNIHYQVTSSKSCKSLLTMFLSRLSMLNPMCYQAECCMVFAQILN